AADQFVDQVQIGDVAVHEIDVLLDRRERGAIARVGEGVQDRDRHLGSFGDGLLDEIGTDETGPAGDEQAHPGDPTSRHGARAPLPSTETWCGPIPAVADRTNRTPLRRPGAGFIDSSGRADQAVRAWSPAATQVRANRAARPRAARL